MIIFQHKCDYFHIKGWIFYITNRKSFVKSIKYAWHTKKNSFDAGI